MTRRPLAMLCTAALLGCASAAFAQAQSWPTERPPRPLPAREVKFPPYEIRTLANGLQVIAVSHHEQPAITIRLIVRAGSAQDPADRPGVAYLAAQLLDQGTTSKSAELIATSIDSIGGVIASGSGAEMTFVNAAVMKESLGTALDLVSDIARNPAFAPEEIERQRQQVMSGLKVSYDDPDYLASTVFDRLVYGFHPYGKPDTGTPESVQAITRADMVSFHRKWFGPNNAILAIVGDTAPGEAFANAERVFGQWDRIDLATVPPADPPPPARRVIVVDRPGAVQTEIRVGNIGLPRHHPDYEALDIALKIFGGEGGNRLHRVLRSERGLTYGASADLKALKDSGAIMADTDTRSVTTAETLRLIVDEMWKMQRQRVSDRELGDAKDYLTGSFPLTIETPSAIALQVLNSVFYGLDLKELDTYRERVNAVTVDDIQRVAQKYLHPDRLSIVLVGDASVFAKQLPAVGFDQVDRIPLNDLDLSAADLRRQSAPGRREPVVYRIAPADPKAALAAQAAPDRSTRDLILRAVRAKGGLDLLRSVQSIKATSTTVYHRGGDTVQIPTETTILYPSSYRVDAKMPTGPLVQVFNAGTYWVQDARGAQDAPAAIAADIRGNIQRDTIPLLVALADGKVPATRGPDVTIGYRALPAIEVALPGSTPVTLLFDPDTALIAHMRYDVAADGGQRIKVQETFSDYRDVRGLKVAYLVAVSQDGVTSVERTLRTFVYNVPVDPALFVKPG